MCNYWTNATSQMSQIGLSGDSQCKHRAYQADQTGTEITLEARAAQKTSCRNERIIVRQVENGIQREKKDQKKKYLEIY